MLDLDKLPLLKLPDGTFFNPYVPGVFYSVDYGLARIPNYANGWYEYRPTGVNLFR